MNFLTTLLYWISAGMMIPVVILILIALGWSLLLLGDMYGTYSARIKLKSKKKNIINNVESVPVEEMDFSQLVKGKGLFQRHLLAMINCSWHKVHGEKVLNDYMVAARKDLRIPVMLMRVGPMLGLMGTLIPMGPALAGLASGDISSMATNMQVAFSTTVIGVFIGAVGFIVQLFYNNWNQSDYATLSYLFDLTLEHKNNEKKQNGCLCD